MRTDQEFALLCADWFMFPRAYYYLRISYQNHARINRVEEVNHGTYRQDR